MTTKAKKIKAVVLRDFWPDEDQKNRVRKGRIIDVEPEALIEGMEQGMMARYKPEEKNED